MSKWWHNNFLNCVKDEDQTHTGLYLGGHSNRSQYTRNLVDKHNISSECLHKQWWPTMPVTQESTSAREEKGNETGSGISLKSSTIRSSDKSPVTPEKPSATAHHGRRTVLDVDEQPLKPSSSIPHQHTMDKNKQSVEKPSQIKNVKIFPYNDKSVPCETARKRLTQMLEK